MKDRMKKLPTYEEFIAEAYSHVRPGSAIDSKALEHPSAKESVAGDGSLGRVFWAVCKTRTIESAAPFTDDAPPRGKHSSELWSQSLWPFLRKGTASR